MNAEGLPTSQRPPQPYVLSSSSSDHNGNAHVAIALDPYGDDFPLLRSSSTERAEVGGTRDACIIVTRITTVPDDLDRGLIAPGGHDQGREDINQTLKKLDVPVSLGPGGQVLYSSIDRAKVDSRSIDGRETAFSARTERVHGPTEHWARVLLALAVYRQEQAVDKIEGRLRTTASYQRPPQADSYLHPGTNVTEALPTLSLVGDGFSRFRSSLWFTAVPGWPAGSTFIRDAQRDLHLSERITQIQDTLAGWALALQIEYGEQQRAAQERADQGRDKLQRLATAIAFPGLVFSGAALVVDNAQLSPWHLLPFVVAMIVGAVGWHSAALQLLRPKTHPASPVVADMHDPSELTRIGGPTLPQGDSGSGSQGGRGFEQRRHETTSPQSRAQRQMDGGQASSR